MLERLIGRLPRKVRGFPGMKTLPWMKTLPRTETPSRTETGVRIYAIGDIHGQDGLLAELHAAIIEDAGAHPGERGRVVYLGDLIDRGPGSRQVIDRLLDAPLPGLEQVVLMGNHEESMLGFLEDDTNGPSWLAFGGIDTVESYGVEAPSSMGKADLARVQAQLRQAVSARHRHFLGTLPLTHHCGDYFFVHAGIRPGVPLEEQSAQDLLWIRDPFLSSGIDFGKVVVHGHTITPEPVVRPNRIGIDTGAFRSGILTCLVLSGAERYFIQTGN